MDPQPIVLLVDDDLDMRRIAEIVLQQVDPDGRFAHRSVATGADALAVADEAADAGRPLLVLCDYRMPAMDGLAVAAALRPLGDRIPLRFVLLSSMASLPRDADADAAALVDQIVEKPLRPQAWRDSFRALVDGWAAHLQTVE